MFGINYTSLTIVVPYTARPVPASATAVCHLRFFVWHEAVRQTCAEADKCINHLRTHTVEASHTIPYMRMAGWQ
jgi:hypothetical protein